MSRTKAAVNVEVKRVISALCRLLADSGLDSVPAPETFRRAKFGGGPEVEVQFWGLLANMIQSAEIVSCESCSQLRREQKKLVAAGLWQTGYHADWMFGSEGGDVGEAGRCSSRELLLALGWLLAAGIMEKLVTRRVQQLDKTLVTPTHVNINFSSELQVDSPTLRKLQWLVGSLRHQNRILLSMQEERTRLLHAVLLAGLSSSPSSSDQSSAELREECVGLRRMCELLESYLNWKQVESIFWTWMDSVVDCHLTDPVVVERNTHTIKGRARVCHHQNLGLKKMEDMLLRLPTGQKGKRSSRGDAEVRQDGGGRLQAGSDFSSPPSLLASSLSHPSLHQAYRARFQSPGLIKPSRQPADGAWSDAGAPEELKASEVAQLLHRTEALLLERRNAQRLSNRMQLQEMFSRQDELVLISP
ncbi:tubulin epsilon and delta complex protein 1 isoform X1 [Cheilinus undulatus]|uniref:tubulin epsilon and delta complex protein 1 isoform X1 n=1 Tax=Cheilinus undulatus TaxID=241271 RepID=UPI001BD313F9|nr:tubulin epsilon and delta complex protein 1 isoform X1 [Cheilinus undulatus]